MVGDAEVRAALRRQWSRIAGCVKPLDLDTPSRVPGWSNAHVLAHLTIQPLLLAKFLRTQSGAAASVSLAANLRGTGGLAEQIDTAAHQGSRLGHLAFAEHVQTVDGALLGADLDSTITSIQGPIRLADYLRTRCVEAVVHGSDFTPPVTPDPVALTVAADALRSVLRSVAPERDAVADAGNDEQFVDMATGRAIAPTSWSDIMPLMR